MASPTILIAGGGPTGLFLALLLARSLPDIPITVLESQSSYEPAAKAMTHMPPVFPSFVAAGIFPDLVAAANGLVDSSVYFRRASDKSIIASSPYVPGRPGPLTVPQHTFCEVVVRHLGKLGNVSVKMGYTVMGLDMKDPERVQATASTPSSATETFTGTYLIAADGGKSVIRRLAGIAFEGETLSRQLVASDIYYPFESHGWSGANFLADPQHYGLIAPINSDGLWRVSFGVAAEYTMAEIEACLPEKFEVMFPGPRPLEYKIERVAPYKAQQLCAETFRKGRVILVGDAAHLTNPYAGLGLATGLLDASSLAAVLVSHLQRGAGEELLDAWARARRNTFRHVVDPLSRASFGALQDPDVDSLTERHPILKSLKAGPTAKPPPFVTEVETLDGYVA